MKRNYARILGLLVGSAALLGLVGAFGLSCAYVYLEPSLPSVDSMRTIELQVPLRVYTSSGDLIAQIGEERRMPVTYEQIPLLVKRAFLAAEDDRFFQHHGIDYLGLLRSIAVDIASRQKAQGGSTITMQAARNMFLSFDKTWRRKLQEAFLTYRMEHAFTKEQIFGLYLNVIFFGERAYGVAAASQTFFGKPLSELSVAQVATLAGIPQAPSRYNPIANPEYAKARRHYVLRRMRELGFIDAATAEEANVAPIEASEHGPVYDVEAQYVAEMARQEALRLIGPSAETAGYKVYTTIDGRLQVAANRAVRLGLIEYDRRYGYRGPAGHAELAANAQSEDFEEALDEYPAMSFLTPAVVVEVGDRSARVFVKAHGMQEVEWDGLSWARRSLHGEGVGAAPRSARDVLARGDVIYVVTDDRHAAQLAQVPEAQAALVALDPTDGAVGALVGGFDYFANEYNRAVQARRQPGSGFKPFLYSAALDDGFTPASVLLDAPIVVDGEGLESVWRPENSHRDFRGPMRLREALAWSRNLVSVRLLRQMGLKYASDYVTRFGFDRQSLPQNLTLALGTLQVTPLELASAYATFANGGFRIQPYFIDHIEGPTGKIVWQAQPLIACALCEHPADLGTLGKPQAAPPAGGGAAVRAAAYPSASGPPASPGSAGAVGPVPLATSSTAQSDPLQGLSAEQLLSLADGLRGGDGDLPAKRLAPRVISPQNDYLMTDMMADVIKHGTGQRALVLHRSDLAGKTGTTNESRDAWFNGFTRNLVATVWVGYDQERSLGETEEGSRTALPIWIYFMREALKGVPEERRPMPDGLVTLRISPDTGMLASAENPDAILETFMVNHLPGAGAPGSSPAQQGKQQAQSGDSLF
ncbi:MAG TPA: penicillin-binding protein 1A [Steroidobacteraceae bacterium]|nr:penicillin-binding protein 1A [Steroidobacteraceae bacterium]